MGPALANAEVTFDWAVVGDLDNPNDSTGYGAVSYVYSIATNEVNLAQYTAFLNAVAATDTFNLYNTNMSNNAFIAGITRNGDSGSYTYAVSGTGTRPVAYVSWFDAARFANWVANGQPTGAQGIATTENGAYTLNGAMTGVGFTRNEINPNTSATTTHWIPTENEWYKSAYYEPAAQGGDSDGYWLYPTRSNSLAGNTLGAAASANYQDGNYARDQNGLPSYLTDGGVFGANSASYYGTNDQGGNLWEWNDATFESSKRGLRGGSWQNNDNFLRSTLQNGSVPTLEDAYLGFRLASVPEPSTTLLVTLGAGAYWLMRRRKPIS